MAKSYFVLNSNQDLQNVYQSVMWWFKGRQYEVEATTNHDGMYLIQARKTGKIRTLLGSNLAFQVKIYVPSEQVFSLREFVIETSRGKWVQNIMGAGFAGLFTAGATIWTGLATAGWGFLLENDLISYLENEQNYNRVKPETQLTKITKNQDLDRIFTKIDLNNSEHRETIIELEKEIDKLEIAFTDEILTEKEFSTKKAILEQQIDDYEVSFVIEEKITKLQEAFSTGILSQTEYEDKVQEIEANVREQITYEKYLQRNKIKEVKLKEALKNGILTQSEFDYKISKL